jgi:hypothetical protein
LAKGSICDNTASSKSTGNSAENEGAPVPAAVALFIF